MNHHLCDDAIATAVAGLDLRDEDQKHLNDCLSCRRDIQIMEDLLADRLKEQLAGAPNWSEQRQSIIDRLGPQTQVRRSRWLQPVIAIAASILVVVGIMSLRFGPKADHAMITSELTLEEILAETESLLDNDSIPGLWVADPVSNVDDIESLFGNGTS